MKAINLLLKILLVTILLVFVFLKILDPYTLVIKLNWNIEFPKGYRKIYEKETEVSFGGDGERYHILEYKNKKKITELESDMVWQTEKDLKLEKHIIEILENLDVPIKYWPSFDRQYDFFVKENERDKRSNITILKFDNRIYVIEDIY